VGKRFSREYQPEGRGRPKGSPNLRTVLRRYFEAMEPRPVDEQIGELLDAILGKRRARPVRRRMKKAEARRAARRKSKEPEPFTVQL
jgi:hypothetical protein